MNNYVDISTLRNWSDNPRAIKKEKFEELKHRIREFGQFKPLVVTKDGEVLGGNMRLRAMTELGIDKVWVSVVEPKTEADKVKIALTDNEEMGYYEDAALAELIEKYKADIDLTKYSVHLGDPINLDELLAKFGPEPEEDECPEVSDEPAISVLGEVYSLGRHRVMCGDSTKIEDVEKLMDGKKADMVFTDPPYNIASESKNYAKDVSEAMDKLSKSEWDKDFDIKQVIPLLSVFTKNDCTYYIWTSQFLIQDIWDELGKFCDFTFYCVWSKTNPMPSLSKRHWTWSTELCVYGTRGSKRVVNFPIEGHARNVWELTKSSDGTHPTQKPIELCVKPIEFNSKKDDVVLDLFLGSGSTLIACEQTNRTCYGMELDPKYVDVIRKRYAKFIGKEDEWEEITPVITV